MSRQGRGGYGGLWNRCLLTFNDAELEEKYRKYSMDGAVATDKRSIRLHYFMEPVVVISTLWKIRSLGENILLRRYFKALPNIIQSLAVVVYGMWLTNTRQESLVRWRTVVVVAMRVFICWVEAVAFSTGDLELLIPNPQSCWSKSFTNAGISTSMWVSLGYPLVFKPHILLHTLTVLVQMMVSSKNLCHQVVLSDNFMVVTASQNATELHEECPMPFSCLAQFKAVYGWLTTASSVISEAVGGCSMSPKQHHAFCQGSLVFMQLALAWWLPTAVLYIQERRSRTFFLLFVSENSGQDLSDLRHEWELQQSKQWRHRVQRAVLSLMSLVHSITFLMVTWEMLLWLIGRGP